MLKQISTLAVVGICGAMLWGTAGAAPVVCSSTSDDAYMTLDSNMSASIECWDWGDNPNPGQSLEVGSGIGGDDILQLPFEFTYLAKSDGTNSSFFDISSGSLTSGLEGSFSIPTTNDFSILFKTGNGQNTPSWWLYSVTNVGEGEIFNWSIYGLDPVNQLSHVEVRVPEPGSLGLMGLGLLGLGLATRRKTGSSA